MPNCAAAAVLLIQVQHKIICDEVPLISLQNVKNPTDECSILRSYIVAACSFSEYKTPS